MNGTAQSYGTRRSPTCTAVAATRQHNLSICADSLSKAKESNESNNCSPEINFAAVPRVWNVPQFTAGFHSTSDGNGAIKSTGLTFNYFGIVNENGDNVFFWQATGGVTEDLSGGRARQEELAAHPER